MSGHCKLGPDLCNCGGDLPRVREGCPEWDPERPHSPQSFGIIDPDYARIFTQARIVAWQYGYACMAHGSFTRDLDLLLAPWTDRATSKIDGVVARIADVCGLRIQGPATDKPHGRRAWTLLLPGFPEVRWVDLSAFIPVVTE